VVGGVERGQHGDVAGLLRVVGVPGCADAFGEVVGVLVEDGLQ